MKILLISIIILAFLTGCANKDNSLDNNEKNTSPQMEKNLNISNNSSNANVDRISTSLTNNNYTVSSTENAPISEPVAPPVPVETEIASFSTNVLTKDPKRNNNIKLTSEKLNGCIVKSKEIFSFTGTVGQASASKGYEKANVFTATGEEIKAYGGGNCQISSTLYNAVIKIKELEITERHSHSGKVYYVPDGKDAAVAYGSVDFKFRNNLDYDIKIYVTSDAKTVNIRLVKI